MSAELKDTESTVFAGTGNVFADIGLPATDEDMLKVEIARVITETIQKRKLTQSEAAELLGIDQPKVSQMLRGRLKGYTVDRLIRYLLVLGRDLDIRIPRRYRNDKGRIKISAG